MVMYYMFMLQAAMKTDMEDLRKKAHEMGLFQVNPWFYIAHLTHIHLLEILALCTLYYFGTGWGTYIAVAFILATSQVATTNFQLFMKFLVSYCFKMKISQFFQKINNRPVAIHYT